MPAFFQELGFTHVLALELLLLSGSKVPTHQHSPNHSLSPSPTRSDNGGASFLGEVYEAVKDLADSDRWNWPLIIWGP